MSFDRTKPWLETMDEGASTVLIVGERTEVVTVSKTGEFVEKPVNKPKHIFKRLPKYMDLPPPPAVPSTTSMTTQLAFSTSKPKVALEKKFVGCACCDLVEGCGLDLVEHDVGMAVDLQEPPAADAEAWILRGDRELLQLEQWGKLNRDHVLRSHTPFNASCERCVRGRGLEPARKAERDESEGSQKEVQVDKFQHKGVWFLVLVLVGCFAIGAVQYREVSGPRGGEAQETMLSDMSAWGRSVGLVGVDSRDLSVCVRSDLEGVVRSLAQGFADGLTAGAVPVGRRAPVAERAARTLKESANTLCVGLESVGLEPYGRGLTYLLQLRTPAWIRSLTGTEGLKASEAATSDVRLGSCGVSYATSVLEG